MTTFASRRVSRDLVQIERADLRALVRTLASTSFPADMQAWRDDLLNRCRSILDEV